MECNLPHRRMLSHPRALVHTKDTMNWIHQIHLPRRSNIFLVPKNIYRRRYLQGVNKKAPFLCVAHSDSTKHQSCGFLHLPDPKTKSWGPASRDTPTYLQARKRRGTECSRISVPVCFLRASFLSQKDCFIRCPDIELEPSFEVTLQDQMFQSSSAAQHHILCAEP